MKKKVLCSKFHLEFLDPELFDVQHFEFGSSLRGGDTAKFARLVRMARTVDLIFVSNPQMLELVFCSFLKLLFGKNIKVVFFDLILRRPSSLFEKLLCVLKGKMLSTVDRFLCIHKDLSGYNQVFKIDPRKCDYVPFKANNYDYAESVRSVDGNYALALGASHRDYALLIEAVRNTEVELKILLPTSNAIMHNASIAGAQMPSNVEHIRERVDRDAWSRYIAESRFVVVPILPGTLQPAGISVYLEAMILGKPVIVTKGASTEGIIDDHVAIIVPPGDVPALRNAILRLWSDVDMRNRLGFQGQAYAKSLGGHARLVREICFKISHMCGVHQ